MNTVFIKDFFKDIKHIALEHDVVGIKPIEGKEWANSKNQYEASLLYFVDHFIIATERGDFKLFVTDEFNKTTFSAYINSYAIHENPVMMDFARNVYITHISIDEDERKGSARYIIFLSGTYCEEKHTDNRYANYLYNKICQEYERLAGEEAHDGSSTEESSSKE